MFTVLNLGKGISAHELKSPQKKKRNSFEFQYYHWDKLRIIGEKSMSRGYNLSPYGERGVSLMLGVDEEKLGRTQPGTATSSFLPGILRNCCA